MYKLQTSIFLQLLTNTNKFDPAILEHVLVAELIILQRLAVH